MRDAKNAPRRRQRRQQRDRSERKRCGLGKSVGLDILYDTRQAWLDQRLQLRRCAPQRLAHRWMREIDDSVGSTAAVAQQHARA